MHARRSMTAALFAATLVLTGCAAAEDAFDSVIGASDEPAPSPGGAADAGNGSSSDGSDGADAGTDGGGAGGSDDGGSSSNGGGGGLPTPPIDDFGRVGFHGPAMLRGNVDRLVVEIDVQDGVSLDQAAVDHLIATMRRYVDKPGGVTLGGGNTFSSDRTQWSSADMRNVASQNRDTSSGGGTVSVYILYLEGEFVSSGEATNAIGVAYNASEFAVFPDKWGGLGALLGSDRAIERAVLVHEWGHLLGLVNLTYTSEINHEDPDHRGHSSSQNSAMYWAIETTLIEQFFSGPPPDDFDDADRADMEKLRDGTYGP